MDAKAIIETYELGSFYSGGGCQHYTKMVENLEAQWLINRSLPEHGGDPDFDLPYKNFDGEFSFSLDLSEFDNEIVETVTNVLLKHNSSMNTQYGFVFFSSKTFIEGMMEVLTMNKKIEEELNETGYVWGAKHDEVAELAEDVLNSKIDSLVEDREHDSINSRGDAEELAKTTILETNEWKEHIQDMKLGPMTIGEFKDIFVDTIKNK